MLQQIVIQTGGTPSISETISTC